MGLKRKISKEKFEDLSETVQDFYTEKDGEYFLDVEGFEDPKELKRAKDREVENRKAAEKRAREAEERLESIEGDDARKRGDIETLEKSWNSKYEKLKSEYDAKLEQKNGFMRETLVENVAKDVASQFKNPTLMLPHIKARLAADIDGESPRTVVLDESGNPSALTVAELTKEYVDNPVFSDMIIESKASGSGATTKNSSTGGSAPVRDKDWSSAPAKEFTEYLRQKDSQG